MHDGVSGRSPTCWTSCSHLNQLLHSMLCFLQYDHIKPVLRMCSLLRLVLLSMHAIHSANTNALIRAICMTHPALGCRTAWHGDVVDHV
eukprot:6031434-Amphidinium_carterae.2